MKKKGFKILFIMFVSCYVLGGCGDYKTSDITENSTTKNSIATETNTEMESIATSKDLQEIENNSSPIAAQDENSVKENENFFEKEQILESTVLFKKTEYVLLNSEAVIREYNEYEYVDKDLIKDTTYNASGEACKYTTYEYNQFGIMAKAKDYIPAVSDGHMYRKIEHIYEEGNEIQSIRYDSDEVGIQEIWYYRYDASGNLVYRIKEIPRYDEPNRWLAHAEFSYDNFGSLIEERQYETGKNGQLDSTKRYQYDYNEFNKPVRKYEILSEGRTIVKGEYQYDSSGNLIESNVGGTLTKYEYDSNNYLIKESQYSYSYENLNSWIEYEYKTVSYTP